MAATLSLSARLAQLVEHYLDTVGVTGSSPVSRTRELLDYLRVIPKEAGPVVFFRGCSAAGSASPCQGEGREFESRHPLWFPTLGLSNSWSNAPPLHRKGWCIAISRHSLVVPMSTILRVITHVHCVQHYSTKM